MLFTVIARYPAQPHVIEALSCSPEVQKLRKRNALIFCGPLESSGRTEGAILVLEICDRAALNELLARLPYFTQVGSDALEVYEGRI
jgi:hypothetical protein